MRFAWVLGAAAALMTAIPASAEVIVPDGVKPLHGQSKAVLVSPPNGGRTQIIYLHAHSVENPLLTVLNLTGGTPDAIIHRGGYNSPVLGQFDAGGNFSLLTPLTLSQGVSFSTTIRAYQGATLTSFNLADLTITGTGISVPEPATWMMMILGFGAIGGVMRRRRQPGSVSVMPAVALKG
jgi:hypothetical protein